MQRAFSNKHPRCRGIRLASGKPTTLLAPTGCLPGGRSVTRRLVAGLGRHLEECQVRGGVGWTGRLASLSTYSIDVGIRDSALEG